MNEIIKEMEAYAKEFNIPIMDYEGLEFMQKYIKEHNVETILELGTAIAYSTIQMARLNPNIKVVSVERDEERFTEAQKNVKLSGLENQIDLNKADALEFITNEKFDLIFIDAAKAQYIKFFERYAPNLKSGGVIISDNLKFHGFVDTKERINNRNTRQLVGKIKKYIKYLEDNEKYETTFIDKGDGIALTKLKML